VVAPRSLLDSLLDIETHRSTGGSLWTDCGPVPAVEVTVTEAEREAVVECEAVVERDNDGLFVGSDEPEGLAF
jgi:hypothetical protein